MTQERTPAMDTDADWSPFGAVPVHGTSRTDGKADTDARRSAVRADASGWNPRVIDGGRGHEDAAEQDTAMVDEDVPVDVPAVDVLDAAATDALAMLAPAVAAPEPAPAAVEPKPAPAEIPAPAVEAATPAAAPETAPKTAPAPASEADSTPHTPHPGQAPTAAPAPAQSHEPTAETPHSTPWVRVAVGWLNPYEILDRPLPSVSEIYDAARTSVADRSGLDRATELAWVYGIGMPITVASYTLAAAVQRKWRGLGVTATVLLWITAADTAPVDASLIWFWTAIGYWVSTAFILPALIQAKK